MMRRLMQPGAQLIRQIGRLPPSPTVDLYLGQSCEDLLNAGVIRQLAPTVFETETHRIVIRHDRGQVVRRGGKPIVYLTDDNVVAGIKSYGMPALQRAKLITVDWKSARRLEDAADSIVVTSDLLSRIFGRRFPGKPVLQLAPAWPVDDLPEPRPVEDAFHVALVMGASHVADARPLMRPLLSALSQHSNLHLTISANLAPTRALVRHPRVTVVPSMEWPQYRAWLAAQRFDLWLYPQLSGGAFNHARSASKLGEAAQTGAALMASKSWNAGVEAHAAGRCMMVENAPDAWIGALSEAIADRDRNHEVARANREALIAEDAPARQRAFWTEHLDLPRWAS